LSVFKNMVTLTEAYYGKPKEFLIVEKELSKILEIIKTENPKIYDNKFNSMALTDLNKNDSVILIEKIFKQKFGFEAFYLCFYHSVKPIGLDSLTKIIHIPGAFNAGTMPRVFNFFHKTNTGALNVSNMHVGINIDILLIIYNELSPEELLAIILHEIGHNMDISIFNLLSHIPLSIDAYTEYVEEGIDSFFSTMLAEGIRDVFNIGGRTSSTIKTIESIISQKIPILFRITTAIWDGYLNIRDFINIKNIIKKFRISPGNVFSFSPQAILLKALDLRNITGYSSEKYADSFATSYGYGPAFASFINKLEKKDKFIANQVITNIPVVNWVYDFIMVELRLLWSVTDPHPQSAIRINSQLKKLKRDLNDPNLNPRLKKSLEQDIHDMEEFINNYYLDFNKNGNKRRIFSWILNFMTIKIFDNMIDYRELIELVSNHEE